MKKIINSIKEEYMRKKKIVRIFFLILNFLTIVCLIREIILGDIKHIITSIVTLILFLIPSIIHRKFGYVFADILEIMIYILIFSSEILGEVLAFYAHFKIFDVIIHLFGGFIMTGIGFSLAGIFNNNKLVLASRYLILFSFCFSMTTEVIWEIFEYSMDKCFKMDMQKDTIITEISSVIINEKDDNKPKRIDIDSLVVNEEDYIEKYGGYIDIGLNDTMKDLIINLIGTTVFSVMGYNYLANDGKIAIKFMIKKDIN